MARGAKVSSFMSAANRSISLKFGTEFDHMTADTLQMLKIMVSEVKSHGECPSFASISVPYWKLGSPNLAVVSCRILTGSSKIAVSAHGLRLCVGVPLKIVIYTFLHQFKVYEGEGSTESLISWNQLPASLRNMNCIATFKRHLKTILFKAAYGVAGN